MNLKKEKDEQTIEKPAPYVAPLIYLGPNLSGGVLSGNTVFKGGKPAHIDELIAVQPEIGDLIVPVKSINDTLAKINKVGTAEHQAYQALQKRGMGAVNGV